METEGPADGVGPLGGTGHQTTHERQLIRHRRETGAGVLQAVLLLNLQETLRNIRLA